MVLETYERAVRRGARIYGEVAGYGATFDASSWAEPLEGGEEVARAIQLALRQAHMQPAEIDYINAHGTGTRLNDRAETQAIKLAFGEHAYRLAISSTKPMIGHLLSAAGIVEGVFGLMTLHEGCLPPTINLTSPDPELDLDYVPARSRQAPVQAVMSTNLGLGGFNAAVIFRRPA
jgi:3-oxoacyl-[acyl-carrier-protein] synthase II/nodulation protein E